MAAIVYFRAPQITINRDKWFPPTQIIFIPLIINKDALMRVNNKNIDQIGSSDKPLRKKNCRYDKYHIDWSFSGINQMVFTRILLQGIFEAGNQDNKTSNG
jgi:hypothetical protein